MQQLDAITLKHLAGELHQWLEGAKVSKIQHPSSDEFLVTFWGGAGIRPEGRNLFYINLNRQHPFCVLTGNRQKGELVFNEFSKPTSFCMLLRKHLNGASVLSVETLPSERVLNLTFENFNELGNKVKLVLSLELMGKHSNMILYDTLQDIMLGVAHGVSEIMSQHRELAAGLSYAPPPRTAGKKQLSQTSFESFQAILNAEPLQPTAFILNQHFEGLGQRMVEDAIVLSQNTVVEKAGHNGEDEDINPAELYRHLLTLEAGTHLKPGIHLEQNRFSLLTPDNQIPWVHTDSVNAMVEQYFLGNVKSARMNALRQEVVHAIDRQTKKRERREQELIPVSDAEIEELQNTGDRLLAAFSAREISAAPQGHQGNVTVTRYESGEPWVIEIDPSKSWVENAQIYYRRAKKVKNRKEAYQQVAEELQAEKNYLDELLQMARQAESLAEFQALQEDLREAGYLKSSENKPEKKPNQKKSKSNVKGKDERGQGALINVKSSDGFQILVGKSGLANDRLVGKLAKPEDLWLHVHQMPGSHVLVKAEKQEIPDQTLLEAANLAVYYSAARQSLNVPVIYTQSRFVRKIPGSYPGHVNYRNEKTVFITPKAALLEKLLQPAPDYSSEITSAV